MTNAPERIWAGRWPHGGRAWRDAPAVHIKTAYVRADLVEVLEAKNQRLREALRACEEALDLHEEMSPHMVKGYTLSALEGARAALRSTEASHDD